MNNDTSFIETEILLKTKTGQISGTLTTPKVFSKIPVALIISGSGPTDRDGNSPVARNDCLRILAHELSETKIASVRFDKRGVAKSKEAGKSDVDLRFDDYVSDAKEWIELLRTLKQFSRIIVIGHSEGSLIGMIAAINADKFISIAGAGQTADKILKEQLRSQPKVVQDLSFPIIDSLKTGKTVDNVNPLLNSLFRPSVQPYMISWFKYDPQTEIKKLKIPILILQGTNDIQVSVEDAKRLAASNPISKLVLLENVNHMFRKIIGGRQENLKTYIDPSLSIDVNLVENIVSFILTK